MVRVANGNEADGIMSSGEKAKSPATFEERNPFDISRRSGNEVAAEIAQRLAAWKQARARSHATARAPEARSPAEPFPAVSKRPPIAAPVQPPRLPRASQPSLQPRAETTAPFFASFSAVRHAAPPAPLNDGPARSGQPIATPKVEAPAIEPPVATPAIATRAIAAGATDTPMVEPTGTSKVEVATPEIEARDIAGRAMETPTIEPVEATKIEAPAVEPPVATPEIEPRDIAARAIDTPTIEPIEVAKIEASAIEAAVAAGEHDQIAPIETGLPAIGEPAEADPTIAAAPPADEPSSEIDQIEAHGVAALSTGTPAAEAPVPAPAAPAMSMVDVPAADIRESEETSTVEAPFPAPRDEEISAPVERGEGTPAEGDALGAPVAEMLEPAAAAPAMESPVLESRAAERPSGDARTADLESAYTRRAEVADAMPAADAISTEEARSIERDRLAAREIKAKWMRAHELDELAVEMAAAKARQAKPVAPPRPAIEERELEPRRMEIPRTEPSKIEVPAERPDEIETAMPAAAAIEPETDEYDRKEPTFDRRIAIEPVIAAAPSGPRAERAADAGTATALRGIALPSIETRIERRRIDTLRAAPELSARRPVLPHIEPKDWDVPLAAAARMQREPSGGTGWAIGLGALLLLVGITAPAAIWQEQRQAPADQNPLAMLTPAPVQPEPVANPETLPEPPQPMAAPTPSIPPKSEAAQPAPMDQASLSAVRSGGELNKAPIAKPPAPRVETADKPAAPSNLAAADASVVFPPVARPFVPEGQPAPRQPAPFLSAPTNGASASVALRPNLMALLKPKAPKGTLSAPASKPAATVPQKAVQKPRNQSPQTLDQMFQTLIDTLSEGQPVNPANKPESPSTRR
jgi:hypothetical protein